MEPRKKSLMVAGLMIGVGLMLFTLFRFRSKPVLEVPPIPAPSAVPSQDNSADLNKEFDRLLSQGSEPARTLELPKKEKKRTHPLATPSVLPLDPRAQGRQKRNILPMGIILFDHVSVTKDPEGKERIYAMRTGDIVRVHNNPESRGRIRIQPGVDVFLAATTQNIEAAGQSYPDQEGWVEKSNVQILKTEQALEFTQTVDPLTFGDNSDFSMLSFYERAMKNPDPVVHRIIGPRLIEIVSLHEDYVSSWESLYRDPDPKIRAYTLAQLKERGVGKSRTIVEDLILRLTELTRIRAMDETEIEVLTIIEILKDSHQPRVSAAFASFQEAWAGKQSDKILESIK